MKITLVGQVLTGALVMHQLFVILLLLTRREERKDHSIAMAVFFAANLTTSLPDLVSFFWPGGHVEIGEMLVTASLMLLGPAVYFYGRALVAPEVVRLGRRDLVHLGPFLATLLAVSILFPLIRSGIDPATLDPAAPWPMAIRLLVGLTIAIIGGFVVATTYYLAQTLRLLARYRRSKFDFFAAIEGRSLTWFEWMIGLLTLIWLVNLVIILDGMTLERLNLSPDTSAIIETVWVYGMSFMVLWQQAIFKPYRHFQPQPDAGAPEAESPANGTPKYQRSALDEERGRRIASKIEKAMTEDRLYRNQGITLRHLSDHTRVPENYLSQVLNEHLGRNFYEFINHWRIRDACRLLADEAFSIIEIGEEVGFNSRSTFNAAFKKETGLTPSEYRATLRGAA